MVQDVWAGTHNFTYFSYMKRFLAAVAFVGLVTSVFAQPTDCCNNCTCLSCAGVDLCLDRESPANNPANCLEGGTFVCGSDQSEFNIICMCRICWRKYGCLMSKPLYDFEEKTMSLEREQTRPDLFNKIPKKIFMISSQSWRDRLIASIGYSKVFEKPAV